MISPEVWMSRRRTDRSLMISDVRVDAADVRQVEVEAGQIGEAADGVEPALLFQLGLKRPQVDLHLLVLEVEHRLIDELMALAVEVPRPQPARDGGQHRGIQQDAAEDGPLGLLAMREGFLLGEGVDHR